MQTFIGTKVIKATPMTRQEYNDYRNWVLPENEEHLANEDGYLVEYQDSDHQNHANHSGYISWSPGKVFKDAYRATEGMPFGLAIEAMQMGHKVSRKGWNGKGIFIELQVPDTNSKMTSPYIYIDTTGLQTDNPGAPKSCVPWLASQTDMLSDDWAIY